MTQITGRCFCGAVRWQTIGPVLWQVHCHCESCRRTCSAPFTTFIGMRRNDVKWTGKTPIGHESSTGVYRAFCPTCGAPVSFQSSKWPDETHLYAAGLDDPDQCRPQAHVNWSERVPWLSVDDNLPKYATTADAGPPL